jgi:hypothetical protein
MKNIHPKNQSQMLASAPQPISSISLSSDEVARRAYFTYVNQGSREGHEVQHWLTAEAELISERNLTRVHGFHSRSQITL